jgi:hypothetical protein
MDELEEMWRRAGLDDLDIIWNRAGSYGADGEAPEDTPPGIVQLSYLLRVYNSAMSGGLGFAVEVNEPFRWSMRSMQCGTSVCGSSRN